jgi:quercetin 2,3-dioxygenase
MRAIRKVFKAQITDMGGVILDQALPFPGIEQIDPFLLLHHFKDVLPGDQDAKDLGIGPHPHRGFSPVTFIFEGEVHHRDSRGNDNIVGKGGTQWMDSGMGIVHSERPSRKLSEDGGEYEIVQFWINTGSDLKMKEPVYQYLPEESTPTLESQNKHMVIRLVSGNYKGVHGPIETGNDIISMRMEFEEGGAWQGTIPESHNTILYLLEGQVRLNGMDISEKNMVWFKNEGELINLEVLKKGKAILLAGKPLNEPMVHYGPFVMNTETEIMEALRDYQMGKMGILIEEFKPANR